MKFFIKDINRTVDLNETLVDKYLEVDDELTGGSFTIAILSKYGHVPTKDEISDEALSELCNDILLGDLKALALIPKAINYVKGHHNQWEESSNKGELLEVVL